MDDDIVTRLRAIAFRCWCAEKSQGEPVGKPFFRCETCDDQLRAAAEIERLTEWRKNALLALDKREAEIERLRAEVNMMASAQAGWGKVARLTDEIEQLREYKAVADMFGAAFRMDEWGQYPPSNGDDVHQAALAYERLKTKEARHG